MRDLTGMKQRQPMGLSVPGIFGPSKEPQVNHFRLNTGHRWQTRIRDCQVLDRGDSQFLGRTRDNVMNRNVRVAHRTNSTLGYERDDETPAVYPALANLSARVSDLTKER